MQRTSKIFLKALGAALRGTRLQTEEILSPEEWADVFRLAREHQVLPLIFEGVFDLPQLSGSPLIAALRPQVRQLVFLQTRKTDEFLALSNSLLAAGVNALVVKGIICRSLYPNPDCRFSADEDVLIDPGQLSLCRKIFSDFGMHPSAGAEEPAFEIPFRKEGSPLYIELHTALFPPESAAYGDLNRFFDHALSRAVGAEVSGGRVLTLEPTDHLFYLICHSFKHFLHSGFGIRQVCDLILFAERYGNLIDWQRVLQNCQEIRADKFTAALFAIGSRHLGFNPEAAHLPACWLDMEPDEMPLLLDLLDGGVYGSSEPSRQHSSNITLSAMEDQKQGTRKSGLAKSLFPSAAALRNTYPYLKKHPVLLPVAWAQRIIRYGKRTASPVSGAARSLKLGAQRVELLKAYGILDE